VYRLHILSANREHKQIGSGYLTLKNPGISSGIFSFRIFDYDDCEFEVSGISYYYIIPAGKLKEQQIKFKNEVADDELLLIIFFKDGSYKIFSLTNYNMSFLY
jgi:hypothetical protein